MQKLFKLKGEEGKTSYTKKEVIMIDPPPHQLAPRLLNLHLLKNSVKIISKLNIKLQ